MAFNLKQNGTNYTLMIDKVSNGYLLQLLDVNGYVVAHAVADDSTIRGYSAHALGAVIESLWEYAETLGNVTKNNPATAETKSAAAAEQE